jgi:predicted LPLAT superfamily acyltransferase
MSEIGKERRGKRGQDPEHTLESGERHAPSGKRSERWLEIGESGSVLGIRAILALATAFGRPPVRALLRVVALYYILVHSTARRSSRSYLRRLGVPSGFWATYRHLFCFAQCAADRLFFILGRHRCFKITTTGHETLVAASENGRGAILLGAHLGSFEAMAAIGEREGFTVNVVGYFRNARKINRVIARKGAGVHARLLEISPGDIGFALKMRDCIERGEFVAILGDRALGGKTAQVEFLGSPAKFPVGVYALASVMRCPVYLTFGLHEAPNKYHLFCELFEERIVLPRSRRREALQECAQRFADRLENYCRQAPDNWFNFYDFWGTD